MSYIGASPTSAAFLTDQFSGNGATTSFTLSAAPASSSSILVAVSGVLQDPSTYAVVGTALNFTGAPPSGSGNISVRYLGVPASNITTAAYRTVTEFTATAGQTSFSVPSYTPGFIDVYRNGVMLGSADYTASNGTTVVLASGATAGDLIETISFYVSSVYNAISNTAGSVNANNIADGAVGTAELASGAAIGNIGYTPVNKAGDTMSGGLYTRNATNSATFSGGSTEVFANAFGAATGDTNSRAVVFKGSDTNQGVSTWYAGGNNVAYGAVDASDSTGLTIWTNDGTSWAQGFRMNRSGSNGSVDLPAQPIISGQIGTALTNPTGPQLLAFDQFWVSRFITYNSGTRRFTVPVAGIYRITLNPFKNTSASLARVLIGINNDAPSNINHYGHCYESGSSYGTMCLDSVVNLSANDYIVFYLEAGGLYNQSTDRFNQFTIAKIA